MPLENDEVMNLSLDDYIRRKNIDVQFSMLDMRKRDRNIDKDELDESLNKMARRNEVARKKKGDDKFSRFNDDSQSEADDEDDEEPANTNVLDSDIEMAEVSDENPSIRFAREIQQLEHPKCCEFKEFETVESKMGISVRSQQWRLEKVCNFDIC